mmetsp:Transcript_116754/g.249603  ORF Transcript_116754/g.249603 Transcript_116754/m.249603 type:complete len:203 (+) Transcript_116754:251-859(+)
MVVPERPRHTELPANPSMPHEAPLLGDAARLLRVDGTVVHGDAAHAPTTDQYSPRVAHVRHMQGEAIGLALHHRDGGGATAIPSTKHCQLTVNLLEGGNESPRHITTALEAAQLCQNHLVELGFAIFHLRAATVAVVDREEAPDLIPVPACLQERVDHLLAILHVWPELAVCILRQAHEGCSSAGTTVTPWWRRREGREGTD